MVVQQPATYRLCTKHMEYTAMCNCNGLKVYLATDKYYKQHFQKGIVLVTMMSCICV